MTTRELSAGAQVIVRSAAEGDALWFNNDLLTFKAVGGETRGSFVLAVELARQGKVTPLHRHPDEFEAFFVLEGSLLVHIDGTEHRVEAGGFVSVPPGVPHAYLVTSQARSLILVAPGDGNLEGFFRDASEPAAERGLPPEGPLDIERIALAAERTGAVEILGPPPFGPIE